MGGACESEQNNYELRKDYNSVEMNKVLSNQKDLPSSSFAALKGTPQLSETVKQQVTKLKMIKPLKPHSANGVELPTYQIISKNIYYEGEWERGKPHGKGKAYLPNGSYFEGGFKDGQAECQDGILVYPDGSFYRGEVKDSKFDGYGEFNYVVNGLHYKGHWMNDKPEGQGQEVYQDGSRYVGQFHNGLKHGKGQFSWKDGKKYVGEFKEGYMDGQGTLTKGKGRFEGTFARNLKLKGKLVTQFGKYEGEFVNGQIQDKNGKFVWNDGKIYQGTFQNGQLHGKGVIYYPNGQKAEGQWHKGENIKLISVSNDKK